MKRLSSLLVALLLVGSVLAEHQPEMPDGDLTVGAANPKLTKELICAPKFITADYRRVSQSLKRKVCVSYEIFKNCDGKHVEIDHLIPLELGGSDEAINLWAQPLLEAKQKDILENWLHREVCADRMSLGSAQKAIAANWWILYQQMQKSK